VYLHYVFDVLSSDGVRAGARCAGASCLVDFDKDDSEKFAACDISCDI